MVSLAVIRVSDLGMIDWGSILGQVIETLPLYKVLDTCVPLLLGEQMGSNRGCKPVIN